MTWSDTSFSCADWYFDFVSVMLVSAASVRRDVTLQDVEASATGECPRWSCPCVERTQRRAMLFASKRHDATSNFRRTALSAAREALRLTQSVLHRIVSLVVGLSPYCWKVLQLGRRTWAWPHVDVRAGNYLVRTVYLPCSDRTGCVDNATRWAISSTILNWPDPGLSPSTSIIGVPSPIAQWKHKAP